MLPYGATVLLFSWAELRDLFHAITSELDSPTCNLMLNCRRGLNINARPLVSYCSRAFGALPIFDRCGGGRFAIVGNRRRAVLRHGQRQPCD
jgi:hypothetical protein